MINIKIKTKGMHCKSCEMLVNESLKELNGVNNAKSDHKTGLIEIDFDESKVSINQIKSIILKEGYKIE